jgi:hypothetical protein
MRNYLKEKERRRKSSEEEEEEAVELRVEKGCVCVRERESPMTKVVTLRI